MPPRKKAAPKKKASSRAPKSQVAAPKSAKKATVGGVRPRETPARDLAAHANPAELPLALSDLSPQHYDDDEDSDFEVTGQSGGSLDAFGGYCRVNHIVDEDGEESDGADGQASGDGKGSCPVPTAGGTYPVVRQIVDNYWGGTDQSTHGSFATYEETKGAVN